MDPIGERIGVVVSELESIGSQERLPGVLKAGRAIVDGIFEGDMEAWRRPGVMAVRRAQLDAHPRLPLSPSAITRALHAYELSTEIPEIAASNITISHFSAIMGLDPVKQRELLLSAVRGKWTVRRLREAIGVLPPPATGRPRTPRVFKTLTQALADEHAFDGTDQLLALDRDTASRLLAVCRHARSQLKKAELSLRHAAVERPRHRVLVVDGTRSFAIRARQLLHRHGCAVRLATNCVEAEARLDSLTICAILELRLPDGGGVELSERLKQMRPDIQCIYVTDVPLTQLPEAVRRVSPLIHKASGLVPLRVALTQALLSSVQRTG